MTEPATALPEAPLIDRQLRRLDRLAEAGLEIALAIERRVKATDPAQPLAELNVAARAYASVAREVRLCAMLQQALVQGRVDPPKDVRRKEQVERTVRIVTRIAKDHCRHQGFALGAYAHEARERLDNDDIYGLVATRPVGELVAMICQDLGLKPNWEHLAAEAWAQAEIESGAKGSPFMDWDDDEDDEAEDSADPDPPPAPPACRPETFHEKLAALARDPEILAAARRGSG